MQLTSSSLSLDDFYTTCHELAVQIEQRQDSLIKLLTKYETHEAAEDEIARSITSLNGFRTEFAPLTRTLDGLTISTFFPLNLPLYSLVLFAIAPSAFSANVFVRPPEVMIKVLEELWDSLDIKMHFPKISLKSTPRHIFVELYASDSDVIIFTGKYVNALDIHRKCPHSLLLYNGSGINPFILFENANVETAATKAIEMRCFNSGQDCAGPDAFFVPTSLADEFIQKLKDGLDRIVVGATSDPMTDVGPTMKQSYIDELLAWLAVENKYVIYGGKIDTVKHYVYPTIVKKSITEHTNTYHEFFAPFFFVVTYDTTQQLSSYLLHPEFKKRAMYVSIFGDNSELERQLNFVKILKNKIVNDVERGNNEYGGFGSQANFLLFVDQKIVKPILVSRDIHEQLTEKILTASSLPG